MRRGRLRISDIFGLVVAVALGMSFVREAPPYQRADLSYLVLPLLFSAVLLLVVGSAIAAGVGRDDLRPGRWGFVLGCGAYLLLSMNPGMAAPWTPVASQVAQDAMTMGSLKALEMGWPAAANLTTFAGFMPNTMMFS